MRRLETLDFWPELLGLKDELSLRELSERFGVTPGAISAALKRTGTTRMPAPPGPRSARKKGRGDRLPPEPDAGDGPPPSARPGSKDHLIHSHWHLLGNVPDAEVAREAGVSVRTVASFRARHGIPGYSGPRRTTKAGRRRPSKIDAYAHLLGKVPDRVVAQEADVSLNAVRNYRNKRGIPAAPRERATRAGGGSESSGRQAWKVCIEDDGESVFRVVIAPDIATALAEAQQAGSAVTSVEWVGELL